LDFYIIIFGSKKGGEKGILVLQGLWESLKNRCILAANHFDTIKKTAGLISSGSADH